MQSIISNLLKFRDDRNWRQFHNPKDLALAISIEAGELNECFLWKKPEDADRIQIADELADVFAYAFLLAHELNLDVNEIILNKIAKNEIKYPTDKSHGVATKYDKL